ncbi:uncharacterized protein LOC111892492 [Lactuca sativa]|uniref:Uncharacterized protein n=1 Tax=Lactuca sativa TaxID=4236 RepID=A0A9R1VMU0_LACSA|nr:uncharacterized protein LOC111892492 [Lactuca sativa]KAJ0207503.1 hypothetical protein LSAT_V11C500279560 [Lactuca sativa]
MAPTLTSNSFLLATTPHSNLASLKNPRRLIVSAKKSDVSSAEEDRPIELPFSIPSFISTDDDPTTLQLTTSFLLTGAVSIFLFRSLRRHAKRAKELKFRSIRTETKKTLKEEALESLKAMTPVEGNAPPLPLQALLGGLSAGIIAIILYKFTTTTEASLNRQTIFDKIIPNS